MLRNIGDLGDGGGIVEGREGGHGWDVRLGPAGGGWGAGCWKPGTWVWLVVFDARWRKKSRRDSKACPTLASDHELNMIHPNGDRSNPAGIRRAHTTRRSTTIDHRPLSEARTWWRRWRRWRRPGAGEAGRGRGAAGAENSL